VRARPAGSTGGPSVRKEREADDPWGRFWERLVVDWVAVAVLGFGLQGLWFGFASFWAAQSPNMKPVLRTVSANLGWLWVAGIVGGLLWGAKRAWDARQDAARRR
jgi:hypothetical protein